MTVEQFRAAAVGRRLDVVLSSLSSDAHTWNLVYLHLLLQEMGCTVTNLGACTPDEVIVGQCLVDRPDLIVISSQNGHGLHDGLRLIDALRSHAVLATVPTVIGGRLDVAAGSQGRTATRLLQAGFDAVFDGGAQLTRFRSLVHRLAAGSAIPIGAG